MLSNRLWDYNYLKAANTHYLAAFFILNCLTMKFKTVTARKSHVCDVCQRPINVGQSYELKRERVGVFDEDDSVGYYGGQIGIEYKQTKICEKCLNPKQCDVYPCEFVAERDMDDHGKPTGREFCQNCGMQKPVLI